MSSHGLGSIGTVNEAFITSLSMLCNLFLHHVHSLFDEKKKVEEGPLE
jgi:hypothetical protein